MNGAAGPSRKSSRTTPRSASRYATKEHPQGLKWSAADRARWRELWQSPQATQWDDTARGTVALLIVYEAAILAGKASAWKAQEARHAGEALGLTPRTMAQLGWRIVEDAEVES